LPALSYRGIMAYRSIVPVLVLLVLAGCSRTREAARIDTVPTGPGSAQAMVCGVCHAAEYASWEKSAHANEALLEKAGAGDLYGCAGCHSGLPDHLMNTAARPAHIDSLSTGEKNLICGNCHFNREILGKRAFDPEDRHGVFMSVGFDAQHRRIDCLDCHRVHGGRTDMLRSIRAHTCFHCHEEAIITMGVFQPVNYLFAGKACFGCHTVHGGSEAGKLARMTVGVGATCVFCHPDLNLEKSWF
jgi:predicted CXXCH cytochrome family protein